MWSKSSEAINDNKLIDTTSPMEAAKGVAKLSGFNRYFWDNNITATNTKSNTKQDDVAVNIADAVSNITCSNSKLPSMAAPTDTANMATRNDATVACTCTNAMLPTIIRITSCRDVILPKLTWVERRDARHMSRLPFRPKRAGTRMNSSLTDLKTRHFWN